MRESLVETEGVKYARSHGWLVYKWAAPGSVGVHDRLHFRDGVTFTIEYKSTGKKATPRQRKEATKLKAAGIPCRCIDNVTTARRFIDFMTAIANDPRRRLTAVPLNDLSQNIRSFDP